MDGETEGRVQSIKCSRVQTLSGNQLRYLHHHHHPRVCQRINMKFKLAVPDAWGCVKPGGILEEEGVQIDTSEFENYTCTIIVLVCVSKNEHT